MPLLGLAKELSGVEVFEDEPTMVPDRYGQPHELRTALIKCKSCTREWDARLPLDNGARNALVAHLVTHEPNYRPSLRRR